METPKKGKRGEGSEARDIELHPDAWDRFTDFVKQIAKAAPQHRTPKVKERPASKGSVHK
jgi:hypothetical protein